MQSTHPFISPSTPPASTHSFLAAAAFGLEGVAAGEIKRMGIAAKAEQGGARFEGTLGQAFRANLWLRTADRVLMILAEKEVRSFEDLYQLVSSIPWEKWLPKDAAFPVSGKCVRSQLMSVRDCQAVGKKAICKRLGSHYRMERFPETGAAYAIDIAIHSDLARVTLDMSGEALNRRGYRTWNGEAPLRETLAAALVDLSPWRVGMPLYDPCCGTGTLLIEAAMKAARRASGLQRSFACESFAFMPKAEMARLRAEAQEAYDPDAAMDIAGSDLDPEALTLSQRHIAQAGFQGKIQTHTDDLRTVHLSQPQGVFLANPPYGERLSDRKHCQALYREMGALLRRHPGWQMGVIASDPGFERAFGRRADKKRRLYNGRLECEFFIFGGLNGQRR
jgi:putative N6-adenine-specific DNA methylase